MVADEAPALAYITIILRTKSVGFLIMALQGISGHEPHSYPWPAGAFFLETPWQPDIPRQTQEDTVPEGITGSVHPRMATDVSAPALVQTGSFKNVSGNRRSNVLNQNIPVPFSRSVTAFMFSSRSWPVVTHRTRKALA